MVTQLYGNIPEIENVFVLCTGRCGSTTFIRACEKIENFTAGHESKSRCLGDDRVMYPKKHIEADNRLTWFLPRLGAKIDSSKTLFVHLKRSNLDVVTSFTNRRDYGIMKAYREGILMRGSRSSDKNESFLLAQDYVNCVNEHIDTFLDLQENVMRLYLEKLPQDFPEFWHRIGAVGSLTASIDVLDNKYNESKPEELLKRSGFLNKTKCYLKRVKLK